MDRVGGYASFQALTADANAFDDIVIALMGEGEAQKIRRMEALSGNR